MGLRSYLGGILGENRACAFLKKRGFELVERNFRSRMGEIDIIAKRDAILHFVEVKFTQKADHEPYERLDGKKTEKLLKTIEFYKLDRGFDGDFQLDLICISGDEIQFFENISF
ncbi:YraN family protein [Campylobacter sp.]|uniref:YraN family protein n=1 Tax=Campylobacter sp. TaxID=205 RepID=UPI0026DC1B55|nr:YraN family protein [Campylobacter sp.]MDO4673607.1 YraN family protein [Campylobacter sp.]